MKVFLLVCCSFFSVSASAISDEELDSMSAEELEKLNQSVQERLVDKDDALPEQDEASPEVAPAAETVATPAESQVVEQPEKESKDTESKEPEGTVWDRMGLGAGISLTFDVGDNDRVNDAIIVGGDPADPDNNGIVRVTDKQNQVARIMLEAHYFFEPGGSFGTLSKDRWGWGPFIAIQPGSDNIVEAAGLGIMIGFKYPDANRAGFNLGLGYVVDPNAQVFGDGFEENKPPPEGEDQIRYKETSQTGIFLLFSTSFLF